MGLLAYSLLLTPFVFVDAMPYPTVAGLLGKTLAERGDIHRTYAGEPPMDRTVSVVLSLFFTMVLSFLLGMLRVRKFEKANTDTSGRGTVRQTAKECHDIAQHHIDDRACSVLSRLLIHLLLSHHACRSRPVQPQSLFLGNVDLFDPLHCMQRHNVRSWTYWKPP